MLEVRRYTVFGFCIIQFTIFGFRSVFVVKGKFKL